MTRTVEVSARTVEDAIQKGLLELGIEENEAEIEVVDEGDSGGLFGFGRKDAVVRISCENIEEIQGDEVQVSEKESVEDTEVSDTKEDAEDVSAADLTPEELEEIEAVAVKFVATVMQSLDIHGKMSSYFDEDNVLHLNVIGENLGTAIGRRGETLDALEYLTILAVNKTCEPYIRVSLDIGGLS